MNVLARLRDLPPDRLLLLVAIVVYAVLSTAMSFASRAFLEADGVTHYLYARFAFQAPSYFVDVWARPVRMLLHAIPAATLGLHGVRAMSLLCAIATALITFDIARKLDWPKPGLAGFCVLAQPLFFLHSFSELTEIPFALLAAAAMWTLVTRRWIAFALICGAMPAARPEGVAFVALALVMTTLHRRWLAMPMTFVPLLIWNTAGWCLYGTSSGPWSRWLIDHVPYSNHSLYPAGPIWRFLAVLPTVVSPAFLPMVFIGTVGVIAHRFASPTTRLFRRDWPDAWLIALIPWGILAMHSILHATGRLSSSGEPRYLLSATPFWALLAARGWTMFADRFEWKRPEAWAALAAMIPLAVNVAWGVIPLRQQPDARLAHEIVAWYRDSGLAKSHPHLFATNPLVLYEADAMPGGNTRDAVERRPPGTVFVYDSLYASFNADPRMLVTPELFDASGWKRADVEFGLPNQTWLVFVSD